MTVMDVVESVSLFVVSEGRLPVSGVHSFRDRDLVDRRLTYYDCRCELI